MNIRIFYALTLLVSLSMFAVGLVMMIPNAPDPRTLTGNWMFVGGGMLAMSGTLFLFLIGVVAAATAGSKAKAAAVERAAH